MKITVFCILGLIGAFGLYLVVLGLRNIQRALASRRWPKTHGVVADSQSGATTSRDSRTGTSSTMYSTTTTVRYRVDNHDFTTSTIHFGQTFGSGDASEAELQALRYPVGAKFEVSYDPRNPSVGVVRPGLHADAFWLPAGGLAFLLPAIMFGLMFFGLENDDKGFALGLGLFAAIFCTAGLAMLNAGLTRLWHGWRSQQWPTAPGHVIYCKGSESTVAVEDDKTLSGRATTQVYQTDLAYEYEVAGQKHYNNVRRFGRLAGNDANWAEGIREKYPTGQKVTVAYFPDDPDLATLETGNTNEGWWLPGAGAAFFLFGVAVFIWGIPAMTRMP